LGESYIVRIYRADKKNSKNLVGTVEEVGVKEKRGFTNLDELWNILNSLKDKPKKSKNYELPYKKKILFEKRSEKRKKKVVSFMFFFKGEKVKAKTFDCSSGGFGLKVNDCIPMHVGDVMNFKYNSSKAKAQAKWVRTKYRPRITKAGFKVSGKLTQSSLKNGKHLLTKGGNETVC
jgi:hypothetical protein